MSCLSALLCVEGGDVPASKRASNAFRPVNTRTTNSSDNTSPVTAAVVMSH